MTSLVRMTAATRNPAMRGAHMGLVSDKKRKLSIHAHANCIAKKVTVLMTTHLNKLGVPVRTPP
ncbi:MAG TPA: hypothetical protein EYG24_00140 [Methylococcales bacterium]|nr:hypothetical protein [Methylococcales bacterium]